MLPERGGLGWRWEQDLGTAAACAIRSAGAG